jgi:hypothetical protein
VFRPLVPIQHREAVFQSLHAIHHPGVRATRRLIAARFCWPQMAKAINQMARACLHCQRGKVHRHVHLQPAEILVPHRRFAHIHVDLVGPLPPSRGHNYLFTIIDRTSRWPEAIPLASITAADCARALFAGWVPRFGVPATITSDRGAQFTSGLWAGLCSLLNIQHSPTTAYHPQSIGRAVPQAAEGRLAVTGCRRRLARPPPLGDAGHQGLLQRRQRVFAGGGGVRLAADSAGTVHQHCRVAVAVLPQRSADHDDRPPTTADATQLGPGSSNTTRGAAAGPFRPGAPGQRTAAAVTCLRRPLPSAGTVNTLLPPRDGGYNGQGVHAPPESGPDTSGYGASQAAAQGTPRCAGATCPGAAAETAGAAATGDFQPTSYSATNNFILFVSIRPPASQRLAAEPTQPLSLPPQSLGGPVVAYRLFLLCFPR